MPLNVFLTVDTEVYPLSTDWRETKLRSDFDRDIWGCVGGQEFGLRYQLQMLKEHRLKAAFFVEPLFASPKEVGRGRLCDILAEVREAGQDIQLHIHPEWIPYIKELDHLPHHQLIRNFSLDQQTALIAFGKSMLQECGASDVVAFRAGDYAANSDTLKALERNGITFDTSYDSSYLGSTCGLSSVSPIQQPRLLGSVYEIPVTTFQWSPWHERHLQLCACSIPEMRTALIRALKRRWWSVVIVFHSFEMLSNRRNVGRALRVRKEVVRRFEWLCRFLAENRREFTTRTFAGLQPNEVPIVTASQPLRGSAFLAGLRMSEQAWNRLASLIS